MKLSHLQKILAAFTLFITAMLVCRIFYSGSFRFIFLLWNLFLAWIPFRISLFFTRQKANWQAWLLMALWLLFFPNSLYIITDLIHIDGAITSTVPAWYDALLLFTAAVTGLIMAFASLYRAELFFKERMGKPAANRLVLVCLLMGSFGVYLGRFLRCNSWDVVTDPLGLAKDIAIRFIFPVEYYRTWVITVLFMCFFSMVYFTLKKTVLYNVPSADNGTTING